MIEVRVGAREKIEQICTRFKTVGKTIPVYTKRRMVGRTVLLLYVKCRASDYSALSKLVPVPVKGHALLSSLLLRQPITVHTVQYFPVTKSDFWGRKLGESGIGNDRPADYAGQ